MTPHALKVRAILDDIEVTLKRQVLQKGKIYADLLIADRDGIVPALEEAAYTLKADGWVAHFTRKKKHFVFEVTGEKIE